MKIEDEIKGRFRNEYHKGVINLTYTVKQMTYHFLQSLKKHGLSEPQYNILRVLRGYRFDGPASIGFLKERMLDKNSDVSRIIDRLLENGLVERKENKKDRRKKNIEITEKGLVLLSGMDNIEKNVDTHLTNLELEEVQTLNYLLDKIRG